jgi:hypothetical protein
MPTYIIRPEREVTIVLRETPGAQKASATALQTLLRSRRIKTQLIIHNPINWEFWDFVVRLAKDHGSNAVTAAALLTCLKTERDAGSRFAGTICLSRLQLLKN